LINKIADLFNFLIITDFYAQFARFLCHTMRHQLNSLTLFVILLFLPTLAFSQTLELGILSSFVAFAGTGACTNAGTFTGDVGTNNGAITGFVGPGFTGSIYNNDAVTLQAKSDLFRVYAQLCNLFVNYPSTHAPAFGLGETITAGVYSIGGAGSIAGVLSLDGGGDPNAVFVIKFLGAFTGGGGSTMVLTNGTQACNVFWIAEGAIDIATNCIIKGTLLAHAGALTLGINSDLEGRMFSTEGAITIDPNCVAIAPACISTVSINCSGNCTPAAAVDVLGSVSNFCIFTSNGAVTNNGSSGIEGDIGTDVGTVSGFATSVHNGTVHVANAITAQAQIDLGLAYAQLMLIPNTVTTHPPSFGLGEILTTGIYYIAGAGSLAGDITLDGLGDPNAIFIFKFDGALVAAAQARVIMTNGASRCNIFWIAEGAVTMGTFTTMKGNVIAHVGACDMLAGANIEGRLLSTDGPISFSTGVAYTDPICVAVAPPTLPIELLSFTASVQNSNVELNWITASENNNDYFTIERAADGINFTSISTLNGAGNSAEMISYSAVDDRPFAGVSYYRLVQTDYDGKTSYSNIEAVEFNEYSLAIYPNPFSDETTFQTTEDLKGANLTVYNSYGHLVKQINNISGQTFTFARKNLSGGLYFIRLEQDGKIVAAEKMVVTD
jgi:hypothetical protein